MKKAIFCLAALLASLPPCLKAQQSWGKIDPKQFDVRICSFDSSANAMVLFDKCVISFSYERDGLSVTYVQHKRIQVLNKDGFDEASISIPYYMTSRSIIGIELKAQTLNRGAKGDITITKVENKSFFDEQESEHRYKKKFAFADVKEGSVIEYEYTFRSQSLRFLHTWSFQNDLPALLSSVRMKCPEYFQYAAILQSTIPIDEHTSEPFSQYFTNGFMGFERTDVQGTESVYAMHNVPALKPEKYITTMSDYRSQIDFVLNSLSLPGQTVKTFNDNWSKVSDELLKDELFGLYLNGLGDHLKVAKELTKGLNSREEKIKAIYSHILSKMRWNKNMSLFPSSKLAKAYETGTGNSAEISMILIDMLRSAGLTADPVAISTRSNGAIQKVQPDMSQFDELIVVVESDSGNVFLDATSSFRPYNLLAVNDLNSIGLRMRLGAAQWVAIDPVKNASSTIVFNLNIDATGNLSGKANLVTKDYESLSYRSKLQTKTAEDCVKDELVVAAEVEISNATVANLNETDKKLKISFDLKTEAKQQSENLLYINPFPVKFREDNPFKLSKRTYPVNFGYPFEESIKASVTVPDNYKVSELPKSINVTLEDGSASFIMLVGQDERTIQFNSTLKILNTEYQPITYDILKSLFAHVIDSYNALIVLEKK